MFDPKTEVRQKLPLILGLATLVSPMIANAAFVELPAVETVISSTTSFASPLFLNATQFIYIAIGVTVALAVMMLIKRSISRLVRGATGSRRRGRGRRRRR